jgi:hypothetical protein
LKTPAQNPPWWTRATDVAAYNAQETPFLTTKKAATGGTDPVARRVTFALSGGTNDGGNTTLDRQETLLLLEYTFDRRRRRRWQ